MRMKQIDQRARALTLEAIDEAAYRWQACWSSEAAERTQGWQTTLDTLATMHEHLLAIRLVIADDGGPVSAVGTLARTVIECGARAWWTASSAEAEHPEARRLLEYFYGVAEFKRMRKREDVLQMGPAADTPWRLREAALTEHVTRLEMQQGLEVKRDREQRVVAIDGVERPKMGTVVEDFFAAQGQDHVGIASYFLGSAIAHGRAGGASDLTGNLDPRTGARVLEGPEPEGDIATSIAGAALCAEWFALVTCQIHWGLLDEWPGRPESIDRLRRYTSSAPEGIPALPRNAPCSCGSGRKYKLCHGR